MNREIKSRLNELSQVVKQLKLSQAMRFMMALFFITFIDVVVAMAQNTTGATPEKSIDAAIDYFDKNFRPKMTIVGIVIALFAIRSKDEKTRTSGFVTAAILIALGQIKQIANVLENIIKLGNS